MQQQPIRLSELKRALGSIPTRQCARVAERTGACYGTCYSACYDAARRSRGWSRSRLLDALLLATARQDRRTIALSKGMPDGAGLDGIVVRNWFADRARADLRPLLGL